MEKDQLNLKDKNQFLLQIYGSVGQLVTDEVTSHVKQSTVRSSLREESNCRGEFLQLYSLHKHALTNTLLEGHDLKVRVATGGRVTIKSFSPA